MGAAASTLPEAAEENEEVQKLKLKGDSCFQLQKLEESVYWYSKAVHELPPINDNNNLRAVILCNRCASYLKLHQFVSALADAYRVIDLKPTWYKGYYRAALACYELDHLVDGRHNISKALALLPRNPTMVELRCKLFGEPLPSDENDEEGKHSDDTEASSPIPSKRDTKSTARESAIPKRRPIGAVYSWGNGDAGQLGQGDLTAKMNPVSIEKLEGYHIIEVGAGALHSVAISGTGETFSWGDNNHHQLGYPKDDTVLRNNTIPEPRLIPKLVGRQAAAVACGAGHTLVLMENGEVFGFGMTAQGQLGLGEDVMLNKYAPEPLPLPYFICLLEQETSLRCIAITTGLAHSFFLLSDGSLRATGMNKFGQLALGHKEAQHTPQAIPFDFRGSKVKHVSCGGAHTLVCSEEGEIFTAGSNSCGQLGLGHQGDRDSFQCISLEDNTDAANVSAVAIASATSCKNVSIIPLRFSFVHAGEEFSAFISRNKHVYTCGMGMGGSLGHGNLDDVNVPKEVSHLSHVEMLAASGQSQVYALNDAGEVYTWGKPSGAGSELDLLRSTGGGEQGATNIAEPKRVSIMSKRKQISQFVCGRKHNLVVI